MGLNSQLTANQPSPEALRQAQHKGWLAGVALRLGSGSMTRNPYDRHTEEWAFWELGFDLGFAG